MIKMSRSGQQHTNLTYPEEMWIGVGQGRLFICIYCLTVYGLNMNKTAFHLISAIHILYFAPDPLLYTSVLPSN